jgi:hypothetical protein
VESGGRLQPSPLPNRDLLPSHPVILTPPVCTLNGCTVVPAPDNGDKLTRFGPFSSQGRAGNVKSPLRHWKTLRREQSREARTATHCSMGG